ncbi:MAG: hypothetical protein ACOC21_00425 [Halanaerobiales bacterium]
MNDLNNFIVNTEKEFKENIKTIQKMIDTTEEYYYQISKKLPEIEEEIDNTIEETQILISYFINPEGNEDSNEGEQKYILKEIIFDLEQKINKAYNSLMSKEEIYDRLSVFLQEGKEGRVEFDQIIELIQGLRGVLKDLKNLSINANIHALQVGEKGAGFKVVSKEINKLSLEAEDKYEDLEDKVLQLREWYQQFKVNIEESIEFEESIKKSFKGKIEKIMGEIISSLNSVSGLLQDFTEQINWAVEPIGEILVLVQNQDIIRQNLENMIKILQSSQTEIESFKGESERDFSQILNYLIFISDVSQLGSELMSGVVEQLNNSLYSIKEKFQEMEDRLQTILRDNDFVIDFLVGDNRKLAKDIVDEETAGLEFIYEDILEFIPEFKKDLEKIGTKYNKLTANRTQFNSSLEEVKKEFKTIKKLADRMERVGLYAKMELTRINDDKFIGDFEEIIGEFSQTSKQEKEIFNKLSSRLEDNYDKFMEIARQNQDKLDLSSKSIASSKEQLQITKQLIKEAIQALSSTLNSLSQQIIELNEDYFECLSLEEEANGIITVFKEINKWAISEKDKYLEAVDKDQWDKISNHLESLIEEFTSYVERKTAQEEFKDLDVDVGDKEGELTLF